MKTLLSLVGMLLGATHNTFAVPAERSSIFYVVPRTPYEDQLYAHMRMASNRQQTRSAPVVFPTSPLNQMFTPRIQDGSRTSIQDSPNFVRRIPPSGSAVGQSSSVLQPSPTPSTSDQHHRTQSFSTPTTTQNFKIVQDSDDSASLETPSATTIDHRPFAIDNRRILSDTFQNSQQSQHKPSTTTVPPVTGQNSKHPQQHRPSSTVVPSVTRQNGKPSQKPRQPSTQASAVVGQGSKPSADSQDSLRSPKCFEELDFGTCRAALAR